MTSFGSAERTASAFDSKRRGSGRVVALAMLALLVSGAARAEDVYNVRFTARLLPSQGLAEVSIRVDQDEYLMRRLEFEIDGDRYFNFRGDGQITSEEARLTWEVPASGGVLRYSVRVDHLRESAEYDARLTHDWALFRGSDLFPPGTVRTRVGAKSASTLEFKPPPSWKAIVALPELAAGSYAVSDEERGYDRPGNWILVGEKLHVRTAKIAGMDVSIGGPTSHNVRAADVKALLRWTVPTLHEMVDALPERLLIAMAGDPMWRGGLSGNDSLYLHADRPLIDKDGSSPLLHELVHVVMGAIGDDQTDWIVEGFAEYYSLKLLWRSGTVSDNDRDRTIRYFERKAAPLSKLGKGEAGTAETARAVLVLRDLDDLIAERTNGERSLDDVLRKLINSGARLDVETFVATLKEVGGGEYSSLLPRNAKK